MGLTLGAKFYGLIPFLYGFAFYFVLPLIPLSILTYMIVLFLNRRMAKTRLLYPLIIFVWAVVILILSINFYPHAKILLLGY